MNGGRIDQLHGFDLLNQAAQQRLRARVADAGGDIARVADEIRSQLEELDRELATRPEAARKRQSDRAFYVAQLTFLDMLACMHVPPDQPRSYGWLARLRAAFGRARTAQ